MLPRSSTLLETFTTPYSSVYLTPWSTSKIDHLVDIFKINNLGHEQEARSVYVNETFCENELIIKDPVG
jgi:hypothetical protein